MTPRTRGLFQSLAISVASLVGVLPLVRLDCEITCAASHAHDSRHCPTHDGAGPTGKTHTPAAPEGCGHRVEFAAALQKAVEGANARDPLPNLSDLRAFPACCLDSRDAYSAGTPPTPAYGASPSLPFVLRL